MRARITFGLLRTPRLSWMKTFFHSPRLRGDVGDVDDHAGDEVVVEDARLHAGAGLAHHQREDQLAVGLVGGGQGHRHHVEGDAAWPARESASTGRSRRGGLTPLARRATISLSLAMRPKASSTPSRKAMGIVTEKMLGSRYRKARTTVGRSAPARDQDLHELRDLVQQQDEREEQEAQAGRRPGSRGATYRSRRRGPRNALASQRQARRIREARDRSSAHVAVAARAARPPARSASRCSGTCTSRRTAIPLRRHVRAALGAPARPQGLPGAWWSCWTRRRTSTSPSTWCPRLLDQVEAYASGRGARGRAARRPRARGRARRVDERVFALRGAVPGHREHLIGALARASRELLRPPWPAAPTSASLQRAAPAFSDRGHARPAGALEAGLVRPGLAGAAIRRCAR